MSVKIPIEAQSKFKDDLYVEYYPDGSLKHFGFYRNGHCNDCWALYLNEAKAEGICEFIQSNNVIKKEQYKNVKFESINNLTNTVLSFPMYFDLWVNRCVKTITRTYFLYILNRKIVYLTEDQARMIEFRLMKINKGMSYIDVIGKLDIENFKNGLLKESKEYPHGIYIKYTLTQKRSMKFYISNDNDIVEDIDLEGSDWADDVEKYLISEFDRVLTI